MVLRMERVEKVSVTTTAKNIDAGYRAFILSNAGEANLYFREKDLDDANCTAANGFLLPAGEKLDIPLKAKTLSVIGAGSTDLRILYVDVD